MILGPKNPPMLAVQLMKPTAAAPAELVRNAEGNAQNDGRYATVPNPTSVNAMMSSAFECGARNHALNATAAVNCGMAKCQRRSRVRSEFQPRNNIPMSPATNGIAPTQPMRTQDHAGKRPTKNISDRNSRHEPGDRLGPVLINEPVGKINNDAGEKTRLRRAEEETRAVKFDRSAHKTGERCEGTPYDKC